MTATAQISRILVFITMLVALWLGATGIIAATVSSATMSAPTQLADGHNGCC
jgi:hypothetical protein